MVFREGILETDDWFTNGKVKFGQRLKVGSKQAGCGVPFVITYHSKLKKIEIMKKLEHLLYQDESVMRVFTPPPMVSYAVQEN